MARNAGLESSHRLASANKAIERCLRRSAGNRGPHWQEYGGAGEQQGVGMLVTSSVRSGDCAGS